MDLSERHGQLGLGVKDGRNGLPTSIHVHAVHTSQEARRRLDNTFLRLDVAKHYLFRRNFAIETQRPLVAE